MMNRPLVSIIIPCYNQGKHLHETLNSVWTQSYENWECIIVNDGSSDETAEVAAVWTEKDGRFKYIKKENGGLSSARNSGLDNALGDYIQFLDSDDLLSPLKLEKSLESSKSENADIIISNFHTFYKDLKSTIPPFCDLGKINFSFQTILIEWDRTFNIPIHCALFKASLFSKVRFDIKLKAKEDWLMWLNIFRQTSSYIFIPDVLAFYRIHKKNMTSNFDLMNDNTIMAFKLIYQTLEKEDQKLLFNKLTDDLHKKISLYRNSTSFKIGNKIVQFLQLIGPKFK